jgi:hypothetical protein
MHLKPTAGCQISILIIEKKLWRGDSINAKLKVLPGFLTDLSA